MIITVVCDVLGEENNGTTIASMNLIRALKKKGHTVKVLCADQYRKNEEGFFVVPNRNLGKILNAYVDKVGVTLAKPDIDIVRNSIIGSDLVHIMVPLSLGRCAVKVARELKVPMTAGFHMQAENFTSYFKLNKIYPINKYVYKFIWKSVYQYIDGIHYPTKFIRDIFENNIKRITPGYVISNGVHNYVCKREIEKPEELKDKIVILSTGRLAREKSQDTIIKALYYSKYKDKIQLILGGQGIKEKYYRKLAKKLSIQPIFKLYERKEIIDVLNFSDLYVHSAEIELEGIACLEAIMCGKLTIVSNSNLSATRNFAVDERCIFKNRDPKDLAKVIDYWIEHPEEKKIVEQKYLESGQIYSQDKCLDEMEKMMFDILEKRRKVENVKTELFSNYVESHQ